jgi:hypothetical protein
MIFFHLKSALAMDLIRLRIRGVCHLITDKSALSLEANIGMTHCNYNGDGFASSGHNKAGGEDHIVWKENATVSK